MQIWRVVGKVVEQLVKMSCDIRSRTHGNFARILCHSFMLLTFCPSTETQRSFSFLGKVQTRLSIILLNFQRVQVLSHVKCHRSARLWPNLQGPYETTEANQNKEGLAEKGASCQLPPQFL